MQLPRMSPQSFATQLYPSQKSTLTTKRKGHALGDIALLDHQFSPLQHLLVNPPILGGVVCRCVVCLIVERVSPTYTASIKAFCSPFWARDLRRSIASFTPDWTVRLHRVACNCAFFA